MLRSAYRRQRAILMKRKVVITASLIWLLIRHVWAPTDVPHRRYRKPIGPVEMSRDRSQNPFEKHLGFSFRLTSKHCRPETGFLLDYLMTSRSNDKNHAGKIHAQRRS